MDEFIHAQNLTRYFDLLESETDSATLGRIQQLLIEEENRFGTLAERLDEADTCIRSAQVRLRQHQRLVSQLDGDGADTARALEVMTTMIQTLNLMVRHRQTLADGLDRSGV